MSYLVNILYQIPSSLVGRAKPILDIILVSKSLMRWNGDLELVIKDSVVPDTNVPELIVHALQPLNMTDKPPNGFPIFIECLRALGLESKYVKNEYAIQVLDQDSDSSDGGSSDDDSSDEENSDENNSDEDSDEQESVDENVEQDDANDKQESMDGNIDGDEEREELESDENENEELETQDQNDQLEIDNDEPEESPKVEWLSVDDGDGDDAIYINSAGYYKRV